MIQKEKMPYVRDILKMMDAKGELTTYKDFRGKYVTYPDKSHHSVAYNNSRTVLDYIKKNVIVTAYGCNPGNAMVIFQTQCWPVAYSCVFNGFPLCDTYAKYVWTKTNVKIALDLIKKKEYWRSSAFIEDADYEERKYSDEWETLFSGKMETLYVGHDKNSQLTAETYVNQDEYSHFGSDSIDIKRLKSGKLRVEVNHQQNPYSEIVEAIVILDEVDGRRTKIQDLPMLGETHKITNLPVFPKDIRTELKVQVLKDKIKGTT